MNKMKLVKNCFYSVMLLVATISSFYAVNVNADTVSTEWTPKIDTTLTGKTLENGMLTYTISTSNNGPLPSSTSASNVDENVTFGAITFTDEHVGNTYYYTISQDDTTYYNATPESYDISVRVTRDSSNNIIALENILKNTNNPNANKLGGFTWNIGGWGVRSTGDGKGTILTLDDTPTDETTVFRIYEHTTGNKDWGQVQLPYVNGNAYIVSGYARIPTDSTNETATLLIRIWDSTQAKAIFQKKVTINKSDGWVPYSYTYVFNGTEDNSSYQVGVTGAGDIEMNGLRVESAEADITRTINNTYTGVPVTVNVDTKSGHGNNVFTFKVKAWKDGDDPEYADLTSQGLTSAGNDEYTFTLESNSDANKVFEIPQGYNYEISLENEDGWTVYSVDGNKTKDVASAKMGTTAKEHTLVVVDEPIDVKIKKVDEEGEFLSNAVLRVSEGTATIKQWISEGEEYTVSLSEGDYTLKEMSAPSGYNKASDIEFEVRDKKLFINDEEVSDKTIIMTDLPKPKFKFAKKDKDTEEFLKDAWLIITRNEMSVASFYSTDTYHEVYLEDGDYKLEEKIAPTGYKLSDPVSFKIENGVLKNASGNTVDAIIMKDKLAKGTLTINKTDKDDSNKFLPNAKYRFWGTDFAGNPVEKTVITDENGQIKIDDLSLGEYHYQEIEAPEGYELDNTVYDVSLSSDNSHLGDEKHALTNEELCQTQTGDKKFSYYDYKNGSYSEEESYYKDYLGDGSVYIGGNAYSAYSNAYILDDDPNDFTRILPYGNVFINTDKLTFSNASILFPVDSPFHLIKKGDKEIGLDGSVISDSIYNNTATYDDGQIAYLGYLKSYIKGVGAPGAYGTATFGQLTEEGFNALINGGDNENGTKAEHYDEHDVATYGNTKVHYKDGQNIISNPTDGYVYKVVYQDATILPDGSIGNLVLTVDELIMESAVDKLENIAYGVQKANEFSSNPSIAFNNETSTPPASSRWPAYVYSPSSSNKNATATSGTYKTRNAIGVSIQWSLSATDKEGNAVDGTISYSVKDLDLRGIDNVWGRVKGTEYAEGLEIISGAKSFAVMPYYDHANDGNKIEEGYVYGQDHKINVERVKEGDHANGLRFYIPAYVRWRKADGTSIIAPTATNGVNTGIKVDTKEKYEALNSSTGRYYLKTGDNETFDSGFAVLLDAKSSTLRWTGSSGASQSHINTQIFDSSVYVRLQQAHGTGGDLYVEAYDYTDSCSLNLLRRDVSMGIGETHTLAMTPQDGWEIEKITIDGQTVMFEDLTFDDSGIATYEFNGTTYTFTKDSNNPKKVRVSFENVQNNHSIAVDFKPSIEEDRTNKKAYGNLTINKKDIDTNEIMSGVEFTLSGTSDLKETVSLTKTTDSSGSLKFENVPAGTYTLHEETPNEYKPVEDMTVKIAKDESTKNVVLDITNEKIKYDLTIKKKVTGEGANKDDEFSFKVTIYNGDKAITDKLKVEKDGVESEIENGSIIKLKDNETVIIKGIRSGNSYTIEEEDTDYTESYKIDKTSGGTIKGKTEGRAITKQVLSENQTVTYTNNKGKLTIPDIVEEKIDNIVNTGLVIKIKVLCLSSILTIFGLVGIYFVKRKLKFE